MYLLTYFFMSWISSVASAFHDPPVSIATRMKMRVLVMPVYFVFLAMAALSAADPACREVLSMWYSYVPGHRTHGINIAPSGGLESTRDRSTGSLEAGT